MALALPPLAPRTRNVFVRLAQSLDPAVAIPMWRAIARPDQLPPDGDWRTWLILAGRGWGKSRTGAETITGWVESGRARRILVVAQTAADARDISVEALMTRIVGFDAEGKPILGRRPGVEYEPSKRRITWANGAAATTFSAEDPDSFRGYQGDTAWLDEVAAWKYPESYDQLQYALRAGWGRQIVTTTPRPVRVVRELMVAETTRTTRGKTLDNAANLSGSALAYLLSRYEGTRLGRQELDAEVLLDVPGALWTYESIDGPRVKDTPEMERIVVAIDPAGSAGDEADETGILAAGLGRDGAYYVLDDVSGRFSPDGWARRAVDLYRERQGDRIVAERNNGGEMVEATLRHINRDLPVTTIAASKGKRLRAEPIAALYEQGRVHHVGTFAALEDQMCSFPVATEHDDRVDALVYALTELSEGSNGWTDFFRSERESLRARRAEAAA